jgi:tellurite resistance protein TerC
VPEIGTPLSLGVIVAVLAVTTTASLLKVRRDPTAQAHAGSVRARSRDERPAERS